jgi:hypothetical protein
MFSAPGLIITYLFPEALKEMRREQEGVTPIKAIVRARQILDLSIFVAIVRPIFFET